MTITELVQAVLEDMRVIGGDETASDVDSNSVKARYERVRQRYSEKQWADWSATDDIPALAEEGVIDLVHYECARMFGKPRDPALKVEGERKLAVYAFPDFPRAEAEIQPY